MTFNATVEHDAPKADIDRLDDLLREFNIEATGRDDQRPLNLAIRDEAGEIMAGLRGSSQYGWLYINLIITKEEARGSGMGSRLMEEAELVATQRGCHGVTLTTFSFQALPFYENRGYETFGRLDDYPPGETLWFMKKSFASRG